MEKTRESLTQRVDAEQAFAMLLEMRGDDPVERTEYVPTLAGWLCNLDRCIENNKPDCMEWMLFRPPVDATHVITRIHAAFPLMVARVIDGLAFCETMFASFENDEDNARNNLMSSVESLADRVRMLSESLKIEAEVREIVVNLSETEELMLTAMRDSKAFNGHRVKMAEIGSAIGVKQKPRTAKLMKAGLIDRRAGNGGGIMLTELGTKVAFALNF